MGTLVSNLPQLQKCSTNPPLANLDHLGLDAVLSGETSGDLQPLITELFGYAQADFGKACEIIDDNRLGQTTYQRYQ